ncbi:MAG TPA: FtsK/SpoIIIE domain-containing protein, partial [Gemmatales bacterium]|nr:FtsK/SpoIIIE domain-containing protein [Gemmatales bacterium]
MSDTAISAPPAATLIDQERVLLRELKSACQERARAETALVNVYNSRVAQTTSTWERTQKRIEEELATEQTAADEALTEYTERLKAEIAAEDESLRLAFAEAKESIENQYQADKKAAQQTFKDARWSTRMVYEANKNAAKQTHLEASTKTHGAMTRFQNFIAEAQSYLRECRLPVRYADVNVALPLDDQPLPPDPLVALEQHVKLAEQQVERLRGLVLPRIFRGWWLLAALAAGAALLVVIVGMVTGDLVFAALAGGGAGLVIGFGIWIGLRETAKLLVHRVCTILTEAVADGRLLKEACLQQTERIYKRHVAGFQKQRQKELDQASSTYEPKMEELKKRRIHEMKRVTNQYQPQLAALQARFDFERHAIETNHEERRTQAKTKHDRELAQARQEFEAAKEDIIRSQRETFQEMAGAWRLALDRARSAAAAINAEADRLFPSWTTLMTSSAPAEIPRVVRIGLLEVNIHTLPAGVPVDSGLRQESAFTLRLPALVPFPTPGHLLLRSGVAAGKAESVKLLQTVMLRYLTSLPPGKVKLTIIDPVGLGENFAAFMHMADFDESLVAHRIWTEPAHIEQRLADLTAHMESIIQKYLRNQYPTIEAYNAEAGEVAEPFRLLVIAGFPVNFTVDAGRRLVSTIASGARCGVVSLVAMDTQQELPDGFNVGDIDPACVRFNWSDAKPAWDDPDFGDLPLALDAPPTQAEETEIIRRVGAAAMAAKRVEVPFDFIAPKAEEWWQTSSARQVVVPLGRVGATRRQALQLGLGTSQHALVAGKTGSGKSTLLHVLITNLALHYSPDEIELYLVDFKKGVEFKQYATHVLPHVRVVAIESEREFGLSVLQRLDLELKMRGDRFRAMGVQDIAAAREADPSLILPRILLIVDEFQEFFTEDDRLSQEAGLVLDRLVRQGRAFGMHVILGSQTIGGAYTLTRSTIDQMAVRIALPCSETDGHLILSEGNSAARLLSRPGDAIYNDMSGLVEGNHPFQVAWLTEERREQFMNQMRQRLRDRGQSAPAEPIVFEGNA